MKTYRSLFFFTPPCLNIVFITKCTYIVPVCVSECVCASTHRLHAYVRETLYYQCGSLVQRKTVEMISRAQTSNTRGQLSYGASIDCKNKGSDG